MAIYHVEIASHSFAMTSINSNHLNATWYYSLGQTRFDGSLEMVAEGPNDEVDQLVQWCQHGPPYARVTRVHRIDEDFTGKFDSFRIVF